MRYKAILITIAILFFCPNIIQGEEVLYDEYKSETGITIKSYTENWVGNRLVEVYQELLKNTHGEELSHLKTINLYSDNPNGGKEEGMYNASYNRVQILGKEKLVLSKNNSINLYNLKNKDEMEDFAKTLSHEYGHHFTLYYLIKYENKTFEQWKDTELYKARDLEGYHKVTDNYAHGHEWSITEIAAEDYVQLYGSPTAKRIYYFEDIVDRYYSGIINKSTCYNYSIYNINPQENTQIPLALELPELTQYWEKASGIEIDHKIVSRPNLALVHAENLGYDKICYTLQWSKSVDENDGEVDYYTLIATDLEGKEIIPIKTVEKGEPLEAMVGSIQVNDGDATVFYTDRFVDSPRVFKVYGINLSGGIVSSHPLEIDFDNPQVTDLNMEPTSISCGQNVILDEADQVTVESNSDTIMDTILDNIVSIIDKVVNKIVSTVYNE